MFWGGAEQFVLNLSRRLADDGQSVIFVSRKSKVVAEHIAGVGDEHITLPMQNGANIFAIAALARHIKRLKPDVIHIHQFKELAAASLAVWLSRLFGNRKRPRIIVTRHLVRKDRRGFINELLYQCADRIVFVSEFARREFLSSNPPVDAAKTIVIRNAVPDASPTLMYPNIRDQFGINEDTPIILFCGRLCEEKGVHILMKACKVLHKHKFALVVVGTGDEAYTEKLHVAVETTHLRDKVFFYGFSDDVPAIMRQADIVVAPSVVSEAGSLVILEAMQAGVPVVTTDGGSQSEYISHGETGLLVPPSDYTALASALARLLDDKESRTQMAASTIKRYHTEFSYDSFYKKYFEIYGE